ncbi:MAG TPA: chemotaxis protein CheB [Clostridiales bacterium]|nr:chemotaxis protein CheB [Clostridiales bacterium]
MDLKNKIVKVAIPPFRRASFVLIASSTGGPKALDAIIPQLSPRLQAYVLVVQHMPKGYTQSLAQSLDNKSKVSVREGAHGHMLQPGEVIIAPGGFHMGIVKNKRGRYYLRLYDDKPINGVKPSADALFEEASRVCVGENILAVILTGMGSDGYRGVQALKEVGCYCITQSEETCVVYGMPRRVEEAGLSDEILDLDKIAMRINYLGIGEEK